MHQKRGAPHIPQELDMDAVMATLRKAAAAAARETLPRFRTDMAVDNKFVSGFDPVTEADREAERVIRAVIAEAFPDHGIIGEEQGQTASDSPYSWIIDPVDGTRAFISGVPLWGTLIGFAHHGRPIAGLMSQPFTGETFVGGPGGSVYERGGTAISLRASGRTELRNARLFTTTPVLFDTEVRRRAWSGLQAEALQVRYGCDCYAYCLLAAGHADLVVEPSLNVYDIAALLPIIERAGGVVATWTGGSPDGGGDLVAAASPALLDAALTVIAAASR